MFGLPPPAQPADQRSLTSKRRAMIEGCRREAVKNAPRVLSRHAPIIAKAGHPGAGLTVSAGSET